MRLSHVAARLSHGAASRIKLLTAFPWYDLNS